MSIYVHSGSETTFPENRLNLIYKIIMLINYNCDVTNVNIAYHNVKEKLSTYDKTIFHS